VTRQIVVRALVVWLGLFAMMGAWALATPAASGPDEDGHLMKAAATVRGDFEGTETDMPGIRSFQLPGSLARPGGPVGCYAFKPFESAACVATEQQPLPDVMTANSGVAAYNPVYYGLVGWPSLLTDGNASVFAMRLMSALLSSALWAVTFSVVSVVSSRPRASLALMMIGLTPFAVYLGSLVNPSGAEVSSAGAALALIAAIASRRLKPTSFVIGLTTAVAVLLSNLRSISPAILLMIGVLVFVSIGIPPIRQIWSDGRSRVILAVGALGVFFALWWALFISSGSGYIPSAGPERPDMLEAFWHTFTLTPDFGRNAVGIFGWLDTVLPEQFYVFWLALAVLALIVGLIFGTVRFRIAIILSVGAMILVPAILQALTAEEYGYIWQGRYSLPFGVVFIVLVALAVGWAPRVGAGAWNGNTERARGSAIGAVALISVGILNLAAQGYAFLFVMRRFAIGIEGTWVGLFTAPEWVPVFGVVPSLMVFAAGALCFALGLWSLPLASRRAQPGVAIVS